MDSLNPTQYTDTTLSQCWEAQAGIWVIISTFGAKSSSFFSLFISSFDPQHFFYRFRPSQVDHFQPKITFSSILTNLHMVKECN